MADDDARLALKKMAELAAARLGEGVELVAQTETGLSWETAAVHPMQPLETCYQGVVRQSLVGVADDAQRQQLESSQLGRFFFFQSADAKLLGAQSNGSYEGQRFPFAEQRLAAAEREVALAEQDPVHGLPRMKRALRYADEVLGLFAAVDNQAALAGYPDIPVLQKARQELHAVRTPLGQNLAGRVGFKAAAKSLLSGIQHLEKALVGDASIQMFYIIQPFYLFRLLVRYRVLSLRPITAKQKSDTSGYLTGLLHNGDGRGWLQIFLAERMKRLAAALKRADPAGNTRFFVKGGRALNYMLGTPNLGTNDWDTQVIINPELPATQWYAVFQQVHNTVLLELKGYKREFYMALHANAAAFQNALNLVQPEQPADDPQNEPWPVHAEGGPPEQDRAAAKAELIDVGIPRHDTIEALEQWSQLRDGIETMDDGVQIPGPLYYLLEYLVMAEEAVSGTARSQKKSVKRIKRLGDILQVGNASMDLVIDTERRHIPATLAQSLDLCATLAQPQQRLAIVGLRQLAAAYALGIQTSLAQNFDPWFAQGYTTYMALPADTRLKNLPQSLQDAIGEADRLPKAADHWMPADQALADVVAYLLQVSRDMEAFNSALGTFVCEQLPQLSALFRQLCASPIFSPFEVRELQIAAATSYAAHQQAAYAGNAGRKRMEPLSRIDIKLYARNPEADPKTVMALVKPVLLGCLSQSGLPLVLEGAPDGRGLQLSWKTEEKLDPFTYPPMVMSLSLAHTPEGFPQLSYISGEPVLSLPDLVREYQRRSAHIEEFGMRQLLRQTTEVLTGIVTDYENPQAPNYSIAALRDGRAHHLAISSAQLCQGLAADYSPGYYPEQNFGISLTDNTSQAQTLLSLGPANGRNRSLDLLVINQGEGAWNTFATWTAQELRDSLVAPLLASGITAKYLVLDFGLSASLLGTFAPLCAADGGIVARLYSTPEPIVDTSLWRTMLPAFEQGDRDSLWQSLKRRLRQLSASSTGLAYLREVSDADAQAIFNYLSANPGARGPISLTHYLPKIAEVLQATRASVDARLLDLIGIAASPNLAESEKAVLEPLGGNEPPQQRLTQIQARFAARVQEILTDPRYDIALTPESLNATPLFATGAGEGRWTLVQAHLPQLLAMARSFMRLPSGLAVYHPGADGGAGSVVLDQALSGPLPLKLGERLDTVHPDARIQAPRITYELGQQGITLLWRPDYLQTP